LTVNIKQNVFVFAKKYTQMTAQAMQNEPTTEVELGHSSRAFFTEKRRRISAIVPPTVRWKNVGMYVLVDVDEDFTAFKSGRSTYR
jgi:hypothetical protein